MARFSKNILLQKSMYGLYIGALMFLGVIVAGISAYWLEGWKFSNAFYMVIITVFSVGYEEVEPVATPVLQQNLGYRLSWRIGDDLGQGPDGRPVRPFRDG